MVAALVFVLALCGAGFTGWHERGKRADAEMEAARADAAQKVAEAKEQNAEVSLKVVTVYKDKIVKIREVTPEVQHDIQVIRESDCKLPSMFLRLYNDAAGSQVNPPIGPDDTAACSDAIATLRSNLFASRENAEQLKALQAWAEGVSK